MTNKKAKTRRAAGAKRKGAIAKAKGKLRAKAHVRPIFWAVDPFSKLAYEAGGIHNFLQKQLASESTPLEMVYVLSPDGLNWTGTFSGPWVNRLKPYVEQAFGKLNFSIPHRILTSPNLSLKGDVRKLCDYAAKQKASLIVLQTHGRTGAQRFFLGSFAESVLITSKVPVLVFNPESEVPKSVRKILFTVDLSSSSKAALKRLIPFAQRMQAEVVIYHKMPDPIEPIVQSGVYMAGGGWINLEQYRTKDYGKRAKACEEFSKILQTAGIKSQSHVDDQPGLIIDRIRQACEKYGCDMVAALNQSGAFETLVMGSITRELARDLKHPLLVLPGR